MKQQVYLNEESLQRLVENCVYSMLNEDMDEGLWGGISNVAKKGWNKLKNAYKEGSYNQDYQRALIKCQRYQQAMDTLMEKYGITYDDINGTDTTDTQPTATATGSAQGGNQGGNTQPAATATGSTQSGNQGSNTQPAATATRSAQGSNQGGKTQPTNKKSNNTKNSQLKMDFNNDVNLNTDPTIKNPNLTNPTNMGNGLASATRFNDMMDNANSYSRNALNNRHQRSMPESLDRAIRRSIRKSLRY